MRIHTYGLLLFTFGFLTNCEKKAEVNQITFTKADSLTDVYLSLQDSVLLSWNIMINDDNQKIKAMRNLLHELVIQPGTDNKDLHPYEQQLDFLLDLRYDQKSMADEDLIEEYDFASNVLVTELISIAEAKTEFAYNTTLQKLVEDIRMADQRINLYREEYDAVTARYNAFLEENKNDLPEISRKDSLQMKPLFQMTYED